MAAVGGPDEEIRPTLRDELGWAGQSVPYNLPDPENLAEYEWLGGVPPGDADGDVAVGGALFSRKTPEEKAAAEARAAEKARAKAEEDAAVAAAKAEAAANVAAMEADKKKKEEADKAFRELKEKTRREREAEREAERAEKRAATNVDALIAEATQRREEAWVNLRDAIDTDKIAKDDVQRVLAKVLRILAKGPEDMSEVNPQELILTKFLRDGKGDTVEKIDVDVKGPFGETALMQAAVNGRAEHVTALIKAGANVNAQNDKGETALMWAAAYNEADVIRRLLENKKTDQKLKDNLGWTALMVAAWCGNSAAVDLLKSTKKEKNKDGFTALDLVSNDKAPAKTKPQEVGDEIRKTLKKGYFGGVTQRNKKGRSKTKRTRPTKR